MKSFHNILFTTCFIMMSHAVECQIITDNEHINAIKEQISTEYKSVTGIRCNYMTERTSQLLDGKTTYSGTMSYNIPGRLSWSCDEPKLSFTMTTDSIFIGNANGNAAMRLEEHLIFNEIAKIIRGTSAQGSLIDEKTFAPTFTEKDSEIIVSMTPKKKKMKGIFANIILTFNKTDFELKNIEIIDIGGDTTEISINNATITKL